MFCKNCGFEVSPGASFCPKCGARIMTNPTPRHTETAPETNVQPTENDYYQGYQSNSNQYNQSYQQDGAYDPYMMQQPPKKKLKSKKPLIIGAAAAVVIVAGAVVAGAATGFFQRTFSSPEKYYKDIETSAWEDVVESYMDVYDTSLSQLEGTQEGSTVDIKLQLNEGFHSLYKGVAEYADLGDFDISWINEISMKASARANDSELGEEIELALNGVKMFTTTVAADFDIQEMYLRIPELSGDYLGMDLSEMGYDAEIATEMSEMFTEIAELCPDSEAMTDILEDYGAIVFDHASYVEKSKDVLAVPEVSDISKKYTLLEATYTEQDVMDLCNEIVQTLKADENVKEVIYDFAQTAANYDTADEIPSADEIYQEFLDALEDLETEIASSTTSDGNYIVNSIWVSNSGEIMGRSIDFYDDNEKNNLLTYKRPKDDKDFATSLVINANGSTISMSGYGTETNSTLNGSYNFSVDNNEMFGIQISDYDLKGAKDGTPSGTYVIAPGAGIKAALSVYESEFSYYFGDFGDVLYNVASNFQLSYSFDSGKNATNASISLINDGDALLSLSVSAKEDENKTSDFPSDSDNVYNMTDDDQIMQYVKGINWDNLTSILKSSDIPSEYTDALIEGIDSFKAMLAYY